MAQKFVCGLITAVLFLMLISCAAATETMSVGETAVSPTMELEKLGIAPEISNDVWINTDAPLRLQDLRGKVVLVEFWTFGCINCQNVIPSLKEWYSTYRGDDFEILGIHYPEFAYEEKYENVLEATQRLGLEYPIALDNDGTTWRAYHQRYWPTLYLVDKQGNIRYKHIGEGGYEETEVAIQTLLAESYP